MVELIALSANGEVRTCKGCGQVKPMEEFYFHKASLKSRVRKCKSCYGDQRKNVKIGSLDGRLRAIFSNAVERRHKGLDISLRDLHDLWEKQKGLCSYSGTPMTWDDSNRYTTASLDRIDSSKGYVRGNIALCCAIVNIMKNQMPLEHWLWWCRSIVATASKLSGG